LKTLLLTPWAVLLGTSAGHLKVKTQLTAHVRVVSLPMHLQEMEKAPDVAVDPLGPAAAKLALARMSELDLAPDQQQYDYGEMPGLRDIPTPIQALR
jgi:hypothetical protein